MMSKPQLPTICDLKFDFNKPVEREAAFAWLHAVAPVLTKVERHEVRPYLQAVLRHKRCEVVSVRSI